jgi:hypothetical protein
MNRVNPVHSGSTPLRLWRHIPVADAMCLTASAPAGHAADGPAAFQLAKLFFVGLSHYAEAQAGAATGLRVGDAVTEAQLKTAADLWAGSGAFDSVSYRYSTQGGHLDAEFQVTETKATLPCHFDNFISTIRQQPSFPARRVILHSRFRWPRDHSICGRKPIGPAIVPSRRMIWGSSSR